MLKLTWNLCFVSKSVQWFLIAEYFNAINENYQTESKFLSWLHSAHLKRISEMEEKPFMSSLNICPEACCRTPLPLTAASYFPADPWIFYLKTRLSSLFSFPRCFAPAWLPTNGVQYPFSGKKKNEQKCYFILKRRCWEEWQRDFATSLLPFIPSHLLSHPPPPHGLIYSV